ncbi:hypothetical protein RchiOBHm_Chr6g0261001 [Rosa chinensis]|uniref:Uncharacterized protein n=1 Tax=Rosa chinensis TaxID=74649 RepID=A0A2P6PNC1_ROSCH|nr:hypothetical protein RchiOBHm_Chr6g0261001 [Rosa chinensis]
MPCIFRLFYRIALAPCRAAQCYVCLLYAMTARVRGRFRSTSWIVSESVRFSSESERGFDQQLWLLIDREKSASFFPIC